MKKFKSPNSRQKFLERMERARQNSLKIRRENAEMKKDLINLVKDSFKDGSIKLLLEHNKKEQLKSIDMELYTQNLLEKINNLFDSKIKEIISPLLE